jgi:hypothetical protein
VLRRLEEAVRGDCALGDVVVELDDVASSLGEADIVQPAVA